MNPNPPFLCARNISKSYGTTRVLRDLSFELSKGECLALLGPSGCGKSTLLNILAGLLPADEGSVVCGGAVLEDAESAYAATPQQRRFSMVFQDLSLWPHMTVYENVRFGLDFLQKKISGEEKKRRVEKTLRLVGIYDYRHRYPSMLSGGQQQRVAIARAIVVEPSVLLMDEPLASLDSQLREELRNEIAALLRRLEITTVYVTHDFSEAMTVADMIAVMSEGRFEQVAPPAAILNSPATTFVASFLGSMNALPYIYELEGLKDTKGNLLFPPHPAKPKRGYLLLRREHIQVLPASGQLPPLDGVVRWKATCVKNSFSDSRYEVHVRTAKGETFRAFVQEPLPPDSPVVVQFDPKNTRFVER